METREITQGDIEKINNASKQMSMIACVLALAYKSGDDTASESDLTFVGLVGMIDPPRPEAIEAAKVFKSFSHNYYDNR